MTPLQKSKLLPSLLHVSAWLILGLMIFLLNPLSWKVALPYQFWIRQGFLFLILVFVFYLNVHILVPRFLFKKGKTLHFLGIALALTFLLMVLLHQIEIWLNLPELMHRAFRPNAPYVPNHHLSSRDMFIVLFIFLSLGISTSVAAVQKWQSDETLRRQLEADRISSELSYLKAQINPHFFFNTLNNIYALTSIDLEKARMALHKLSRMMRYVLYETEKDRTLLGRETDFIKDFLILMKLRISEKVQVELDIEEKITDTYIAPMVLLPFIENCFKHGISARQKSHIMISLRLRDGLLHLRTVNTINNGVDHLGGQRSGIGLNNTKRRLDLIYGNRFALDIDADNPENEYRVDLKIDLG